jgi:SAM-dependent methyltransferase
MTWDAERYDRWFHTPEGRVALFAERRLLESLVAAWPRRGRSLLEVGCGTGVFLEHLYQTGFDVTGVDRSESMAAAARQRLGCKADIQVANAERLPFGDKEFDYVVLWGVLEFCDDPLTALREAARAAARGVLVGYLNRWSAYWWTHGRNRPEHTLGRARWFSWPEMRRMAVEGLGRPPRLSRSVLPGPPVTWRPGSPWKYLNSPLYPALLGAFAALRVDFVDEKPLTPIGTLKAEPGLG